MSYLGLALFAEGPTDHAFLRPLLRRLCEELCAQYGERPVEVSDVLELHSPDRFRSQDRSTQILVAAREAMGAWNILFVHGDGAGDPDAARRNSIEPGCARIAQELADQRGQSVAVVPVRETEAWALADGETLRSVFGSTLSDTGLGVPLRPQEVESVLDPKKSLDDAYIAAAGRRRGRRRGRASFLLSAIGEQVRLSVLGMVPAFERLTADLTGALKELRYLRRET